MGSLTATAAHSAADHRLTNKAQWLPRECACTSKAEASNAPVKCGVSVAKTSRSQGGVTVKKTPGSDTFVTFCLVDDAERKQDDSSDQLYVVLHKH